MTANAEPMVPQGQGEFQHLLAYVTGPEAGLQTASTVEVTLFRRLLALGAVLLRLFLVTRAAAPGRTGASSRWHTLDVSRSAPDDLLFSLWQGALRAA